VIKVLKDAFNDGTIADPVLGSSRNQSAFS
jgi:hypothetical protein